MKNDSMHSTTLLSQLKLDGRYAKLLKAFAELHELKHHVTCGQTNFGLGLEVSVTAEMKCGESSLDVFMEGQAAYVSSMREYTQAAREDLAEAMSKKILQDMFGDDRYIKSLKGDAYMMLNDSKPMFVPRLEIHSLPRSEEELVLKLALAGISWEHSRIFLRKEGRDA